MPLEVFIRCFVVLVAVLDGRNSAQYRVHILFEKKNYRIAVDIQWGPGIQCFFRWDINAANIGCTHAARAVVGNRAI